MARTVSLFAAAVLLLPLQACSVDEVLEVTDPDIVNPKDLQSAAGAAAAFAGGVGDFSFAIVGDAGGTEGQVLVGGSMSDELMNSETFPTRQEYENRSMDERNGTLTAVIRSLHRARRSLELSTGLLQTYAPTPASRIGEAFALAGYTYLFFGESYCSGVPFSSLEDGLGMPRTTAEMFNLAVERFDTALTYFAATDTATVARARMARVGKARALVNLGRSSLAAAAAVVAGVPDTFRYRLTHTTTTGRQQNGVHVFIWLSERFSVADGDGTTGLNFRSANDPRVRFIREFTVTQAGDTVWDVGFDESTPQYNPLKFPTRTTPTPIAEGLEAKLIIAEALLEAGNVTAWLDTLNFLRTRLNALGYGGTLGALTDPGTAAGREDLHFRERAFWLYLTGHRLGDLRRLMRQYNRAEDAVFPTGISPKGVTYGNDVAIPVSFDERNNPNYTGCSTTTP